MVEILSGLFSESLIGNLVVMMTAIWLFGRLFKKLRLPPIFGELLAGIIIGPAVLGLVHETEAIIVLAELGIFFFMFHAGIETDPSEFFGVSKKVMPIALGGMILPFAGGFFVGHYLEYSLYESLYIGLGLSVTSIVLCAKILKESGAQKTPTGHICMGAALVDDILALLLFSVVLDVAKSGSIEIISILILVAKIVGFFGVILFIGQHFFNALQKVVYSGNKGFTFLVTVALIFGFVAELIGLHFIVGAFLAGLFIRQEVIEDEIFAKVEDRIFGISHSLFGPIFIASLGFHLNFQVLIEQWWAFVLLLVVAVIGKVFGAGVPAYLQGMKPEESIGLGVLMNNRGEVVMILATIGLAEGIIKDDLFSLLILLSFSTTLITVFWFRSIAKKLHPPLPLKS